MGVVTLELTIEQLKQTIRRLSAEDRLRLIQTLLQLEDENQVQRLVDGLLAREDPRSSSVLKKIDELRHEDPKIWFLAGEALLDLNQHRQAMTTFLKLLEESLSSKESWRALKEAFLKYEELSSHQVSHERQNLRRQLTVASDALAADYANDKELIAFSEIDADRFYESR